MVGTSNAFVRGAVQVHVTLLVAILRRVVCRFIKHNGGGGWLALARFWCAAYFPARLVA